MPLLTLYPLPRISNFHILQCITQISLFSLLTPVSFSIQTEQIALFSVLPQDYVHISITTCYSTSQFALWIINPLGRALSQLFYYSQCLLHRRAHGKNSVFIDLMYDMLA